MKTRAIIRAHCQADIISDALLVVHHTAQYGGSFYAETALKKLSGLRKALNEAEAELMVIAQGDGIDDAA